MVFTSRAKAFCVLEYARTNSNKTVQRAFVKKLSKKSPTAKQIWINIALETVTQDMLHRVWEELDYRLDVCRLTGGAHNEHLQNRLWNSRAFKFLIQIYKIKYLLNFI